eukprot:2372663-Amphidinium_carterae.2
MGLSLSHIAFRAPREVVAFPRRSKLTTWWQVLTASITFNNTRCEDSSDSDGCPASAQTR